MAYDKFCFDLIVLFFNFAALYKMASTPEEDFVWTFTFNFLDLNILPLC